MKIRHWRAACVILFLFVGGANVRAEPHPSAIVFGAGVLDVFGGDPANEFAVEYRFRSRSRWQPLLTATWSTNGSRFLGAGVLLHAGAIRNWDFAIGFAPGFYEREHGPRLGSRLEFHSSLELSRPLARGRRVGFSVGHISNGSFADRNPGAETVRLFWVVPFRH